jgi:hypothetical protein
MSFVNYKDICPELSIFCERYDAIREEYFNNINFLEFKDFTKEQDEYISENKKGYPILLDSYNKAKNKTEEKGWHVSGVYYNRFFWPRNSKFLPILSETISKVPGIVVCGINILDPGISLEWHNDLGYLPEGYSSNMKILRTLFCIDCPEEDGKSSIIQMKGENDVIETKIFVNNEIYAFWPLTTHRVENNLTKPRTVFAIDILVE